MKVLPRQETHYSSVVWVNPTLESIRREECLCLNCSRMKPGNTGHCAIAESLYKICAAQNIALAVTRCPIWEPKP